MKKLFAWLILCAFAVCSSLTEIHAQQFQWTKGGGTFENLGASGSTRWEQTKFMCTDPHGNLYVLSIVGNDPITADTFHATPYGDDENMLLTSYNCNGQLRWAKLMASSGADCIPHGIAADSLGHIYIAGQYYQSGGTMHVGHDTAISGTASQYLIVGVIQFDTSGHFNWIRYVGNNTLATAMGTGALNSPLTVDGANNAHYFAYVRSGVALMTGVTSSYGVYDLAYNPAGTLLSAKRLDLDSDWWLEGVVIDPATNKLYAYGEGGSPVDSFFAAAYDTARHSLWWYGLPHSGGLSGIALDPDKHLHFSGGTDGGPFIYRDDTVSNTHFGGNISVIVTTDTTGIVEWIRHFDCTLLINGFGAVALLPHGKIAAVGSYVGEIIADNGTNIVTPAGEHENPYFVVVDSTGDLQTIQQMHGDGANNWGLVAASDWIGNLYFAGAVTDSIWAGSPPIPAYHTVGGNSDFFVMKYGVDCSCTSMPVASYTDTGTHTFGFNYTGTTTGIDSIVWSYGDGATGTGISASHTYTTTGTYNACVTVYTNCGNDSVCHTVTIATTGVPPLTIFNVQVYPNPANDELHIVGVPENTGYRLLNVTGECVMRGSLKAGGNIISTHALFVGVYILEVGGADGLRNIVRVVKE